MVKMMVDHHIWVLITLFGNVKNNLYLCTKNLFFYKKKYKAGWSILAPSLSSVSGLSYNVNQLHNKGKANN